MRLLVVVGMVLGFGVSASHAQQLATPGTKTVKRAATTVDLLNKRIDEITFENAPLDQVLEFIAQDSGFNVQPRWQVLEDASVPRDKAISLRLKNIRLSQLLWMVMNEAGGTDLKLAYRASGNLLIISTADDLGKEMIVKTYDVTDLLVRVPRFSGPELDLSQTQQFGQGGSGGQSIFQGGDTNDNDRNDDQRGDALGASPEMQELITLIQNTVEPDSWSANGGAGTINAFRGQLVVRNNIFVHQRLGGYIEEED